MKRLKNLLRDRRGSAILTEFALGSLILIPAFTGTFQFGYIFYRYNTLARAVDSGAHYAALYPIGWDAGVSCSGSGTPLTNFQTAVANMVVYGNPAGSTSPVVPGLTTSNVDVTVSCNNSAGTNIGVPVKVTVSIGTTTTFTINGIFGSIVCAGKPTTTFAYQGIYSPPT